MWYKQKQQNENNIASNDTSILTWKKEDKEKKYLLLTALIKNHTDQCHSCTYHINTMSVSQMIQSNLLPHGTLVVMCSAL